MPPIQFELGEVVRLRKAHPCGGTDWEVTRLGADIGLRCLTCGRRVLLERATLEKRLKQRVTSPNDPNSPKLPDEASVFPQSLSVDGERRPELDDGGRAAAGARSPRAANRHG